MQWFVETIRMRTIRKTIRMVHNRVVHNNARRHQGKTIRRIGSV